MLKINRLRVEIQTDNGLYGVDETFKEGLNFLASDDNTCGKSSILESIYYCLGFEEIIGGKGEKVLTSAYKTFIEEGQIKRAVLESKAYLEISNGKEEITLFRSAKMPNRDSKLITVYYSKFENMHDEKVEVEDMYIHMPNSAVNIKGFHRYLEKYLHLEVPLVPAADGVLRKLYLQLIFSCMFIEQKHGWGDIFSGMPMIGIKDAKKRVIEFVLKLDTLNNEKRKESLKNEENRIKIHWESLIKEIYNEVNRNSCTITGIPFKPCILTEMDLLGINLLKDDENVKVYIADLQREYETLVTIQPKIVDNFDMLQKELDKTESDIEKCEEDIKILREGIAKANLSIRVLNDNIEIIENDLKNNKDAARLRELGSKLGCSTFNNVCPVCQQAIEDSLLPTLEGMEIMSIDENIRHLEAQKVMLNFAKESHRQNKEEMDIENQRLQGKVFSLRRLAKAIRSDLYSVDEEVSEAIVYKKIELQSQIGNITGLCETIELKKQKLFDLSNEWKIYLEGKERIPKNKFTEQDVEKIKILRSFFVDNLKQYGYKSIGNMGDINISEETYLPVIEEFDMKFDSSASDNIRGIWAYTMALMQTSITKGGNHPNILIFDEPNQHSIVSNDMENFFNSIINLGTKLQTIIGITIKDTDTREMIGRLPVTKYKLIPVNNKAFNKLDI